MSLFAVRGMFDAKAARLLARSRPQAVLKALEAMIAEMRRAVRARGHDDYGRIAAQFHDLTVAECGNRLIAQLYDRIRTDLRRYQTMMADLPGSAAQSIREHQTILAAIGSGRAAARARSACTSMNSFTASSVTARPTRRKPDMPNSSLQLLGVLH